MKPVIFTCKASLPLTPTALAEQILDVTQWSDFPGCWPIPGIQSAAYEMRTEQVVGSLIRVTNRDGSRHLEEITEWSLPHRLVLELKDFSPPLSRLATYFVETWEFTDQGATTLVQRHFSLYPKSQFAKPALWLISHLLRRAVARHLQLLERS